MKVLMINGSPNKNGCTARALEEIDTVLRAEGIDTEIVQIGRQAIRGCVSCDSCSGKTDGCVFKDDPVNETARKFQQADGLIVGSPVYYGSANGSLIAFLDRLFYSSRFDKTMKLGAAVVSCRRGGNTATFDILNKYFTISGMPVVASQYWNMVHGFTREDVEKDLEGLQTMRTLGRNMAFLLRAIAAEKEKHGLPAQEAEHMFTSFPDGL
ncbi:MAG: flavodoxin family protein [Clostridia bacterium]|nr:flavodoxin family protein [Clostridia bacterium]